MATYFDLPGMKDLKTPIFAFAEWKTKQEIIKSVISQLRYKGFENDSDLELLIEFVGGGIYYDETPPDELKVSNGEKGCSWFFNGGPNSGHYCGRKLEDNKFCKFHNSLPKRYQPSEIRKIMCELLCL